jgi:simple sugar transport system substrate-binding protein
MIKKSLLTILILTALIFTSCSEKEKTENSKVKSIAVFIPGVIAGSPTYEMLADGVEKAVAQAPEGTEMNIIEGGFNQGEWENKITAIASTGSYDVIITSNPAMPEICSRVSDVFPEQKFIILDGYLDGKKNIYTFLYNSYEQAYLIGKFGALITKSNTDRGNSVLKAGLIAGQEYPMMNNVIRPGFTEGIKSVDKDITLDFRIVGNWYDASKGAELADKIFDSGADVILAIAGGASQGIISAAREKGKYVLWFDNNGYSISEGVVIGCSAMRQDKAAYEAAKKAVEGTLIYGKAVIKGVSEDYVYFVDNDPVYKKYVAENIQNEMKKTVSDIKEGKIKLEMPHF